ncbi:unnamed protein product [Phytophthora lilii]|uniref:Unnamed protein product n=1 Tax=Phytophthora lilii TaxID=2077276 RepID=A0A9W6YI39_9STRA|nr:unnamed protein product [Phytophthora lilii]
MRLAMQETTPSRPIPNKAEFDGITSICSTSTSQNSHAAAHPAMVYIGVETGQIFSWDLRSLTGKAQPDGSTRRSAIPRRRSSDSKPDVLADVQVLEEVTSRRTSRVDGTAALSLVPSTKSWMAHLAGVLSLQNVPWPGELLSLGADGVVKIWDHTTTCVGHILTTGEQTSSSASAWKFVRRDHTVGGDDKELFEKIAREVIVKHQRRMKKEMSRQRKAGQKQNIQPEQAAPDSSFTTPSSLLEVEPTSKMQLRSQSSGDSLFPDASTAMINAANALLMQVPFSVTSVTSGIQHGLFGPEEAQHLRAITKNSNALMADVADKKKRVVALAPLFSSPEEMERARAKAKAKARAMMNNGQQTPELSTAGSRTLTNYPLELERRAAAMAKVSVGALRAIDIEPSQFLRDKLQDAASPLRKPVKSTPKKRLQRPPTDSNGLDIKMNASVVILARNVSLPKLTQPSSGHEMDELSRSPGTLTSSVSESALPSSTTLSESPPPTSSENLRRNSNIERKLKLCQKIVAKVCLMSSKPKVPNEQTEQHQPMSPTSSMRRKTSTLSLSPGKNPFGPHYTVKQVEQLAIGLARLDEDGSGDLDQHEWTQLVKFCGLESSTKNSATSVENLFHSLDRDSNGTISLRELLPTLVSWS